MKLVGGEGGVVDVISREKMCHTLTQYISNNLSLSIGPSAVSIFFLSISLYKLLFERYHILT